METSQPDTGPVARPTFSPARTAARIAALAVVGLLAAVIGAAAIFVWSRSTIPTFVFFTSALHGLAIGLALMWAAGWLGVRSAAARAVIAVGSGLLSIGVLTVAQYVDDAYAYRNDVRRTIARSSGSIGPDRAAAVVGAVDAHARADVLALYDRSVLEPVTGRRGVIGHVLLQDRRGDLRLWLFAFEALTVLAIAIVTVSVIVISPKASAAQAAVGAAVGAAGAASRRSGG